MDFGSISKKSLAYPHVAKNVILKFRKDLTSSFLVFAPTRKRNAGQNPGATKIPLPIRAGDKKGNLITFSMRSTVNYIHMHILSGIHKYLKSFKCKIKYCAVL